MIDVLGSVVGSFEIYMKNGMRIILGDGRESLTKVHI